MHVRVAVGSLIGDLSIRCTVSQGCKGGEKKENLNGPKEEEPMGGATEKAETVFFICLSPRVHICSQGALSPLN